MSRLVDGDVDELLATLRRVGAESEVLEVKSGAGGFPQSVRETLVAFANTEGGTVLVGVDELAGYAVVALESPSNIRDRLVGLAREAITPPLDISSEIVETKDGTVVVATVQPLSNDQRPAFVTTKGITGGSYIRRGDGDSPVNQQELALIIGNRNQPVYDREPVPGTSTSDLDRASLLRTLERVRAASSRLRDTEEPILLHRLNITESDEPGTRLTLAGLLTFGQYPQSWFPQLMVSVAVHPSEGSTHTRFLDSVTCRGPIPDMVAEAVTAVRRNIGARAQTEELGRRDVLEVPTIAVREAVVNALLHRDYSPTTRGTQVAIDLFPDRLEIRSPGGLYGIGADDLGTAGASSSRNSVLASLLTETYLPGTEILVAENRATGIPMIIDSARNQGLPLPKFKSNLTAFSVAMSRSELLSPSTRAWIHRLGVPLPTPLHEIAVAMLRGGFITNEMLRRWGADRIRAGQVLRDLVDQGIAVKDGGRRWARYLLDPAVATSEAPASMPPTDPRPWSSATSTAGLVAEAISGVPTFTAAEIVSKTGLSRPAVVKQLNELIDDGKLISVGAPQSPKRHYRQPDATKEKQ